MFRAATASVMLALAEVSSQPARGALLAITLAITVAAWLGLAALAAPFVDAGGTGRGVTVSNSRGSMTAMPQRYATRIAALPNARDVDYTDVLPVICNTPSTAATLNAIGGPGTHRDLEQFHIGPQLEAKWNADPLGVLVGAKLAADCGWRTGMNVSPPDPSGQPVEIHVTGIYRSTGGMLGGIAIAHYDYVNRLSSMAGRHKVLFITAYADSPRGDEALAAKIEALFAHDDPPVTANTNATTQSALGSFGKIQNLLALVMGAVFLCAMLVLVSVLAHAAAQGRRQMAMLQVLGFSRASLFGNFTLEYVLIVIVGGALGVGLGLGVLAVIRHLTHGISALLGQFTAPAWAWHWLPLWLAVLLAAALIAPALAIARVRPIDHQGI